MKLLNKMILTIFVSKGLMYLRIRNVFFFLYISISISLSLYIYEKVVSVKSKIITFTLRWSHPQKSSNCEQEKPL